MAEWGRHDDADLLRALGCTRATVPCAATLFLVFRRLDRARFEALRGGWAEEVLAATSPPPDEAAGPAREAAEPEGSALEGTTRRGSRLQGAPGMHLLSAVSHRLGLTLGRVAVADTTNAMPVAPAGLRELVLAGRVVTMDALLTQRAGAQTILEGGGDDVMLRKGTHPEVLQDVQTVFTTPPSTRRS
ncbi:MAG TPA: hypothetical protein VGR27_13205 [Longimicrobiaceae bacterium]|nr:hypothetical protein [Longimicrobiaceae bacterium]